MRFELFRSKSLLRRRPEWRWRLRANNNRIIASSGEGYHNRADAVDAIDKVKATGLATDVREVSR